jgi:hypothetical protein
VMTKRPMTTTESDPESSFTLLKILDPIAMDSNALEQMQKSFGPLIHQ